MHFSVCLLGEVSFSIWSLAKKILFREQKPANSNIVTVWSKKDVFSFAVPCFCSLGWLGICIYNYKWLLINRKCQFLSTTCLRPFDFLVTTLKKSLFTFQCYFPYWCRLGQFHSFMRSLISFDWSVYVHLVRYVHLSSLLYVLWGIYTLYVQCVRFVICLAELYNGVNIQRVNIMSLFCCNFAGYHRAENYCMNC